MMIAHFEIQELLGEGSFGTVFKAWDTELRRHVALKVPREGRVNKDTSKMFLRDARAAAGVSHPNVVAVYEMGQHENSFYIASELIDGISLSEYLKTHSLEPAAATQLVIKVLRGVQVFHDKGIIHRDLKPGNILFDSRSEPHICDFGLAKSEDHADVTVTNSGRIVGTLLYMPPEQARGEVRNVSSRSDIYSIGVILYELLTGQRPFKSTSSRTLLYSILTDQPALPRALRKSIPRDLETICLKAMEKDPARRYPTAAEMADDLQRFLDHKPILARPVSILGKSWRLIRRHRLISAMLAILISLSAVVIFQLTRPPKVQIVTAEPEIKLVEKPPLRHAVHLSFSLAGNKVPPNSLADWTILPLDKRTREPVEANAIRLSQSAVADQELEPGEYLIVVNVEGFGFHEVYRYVPEVLDTPVKPSYAHERWEVNSKGTIDLPPISIRSTAEVVEGMIEVPGGRFAMGDGRDTSPVHDRDVAAFFVNPHEVTAEQFNRFVTLSADYELPRDAPMVLVHWNAATAYAEFMGKRLVKEHEFEYLARNLGGSNYPSGDASAIAAGAPWIYSVAGQPDSDVLTQLRIFGIHSNVAEWTDSLLNQYPGEPQRGPEIERAMNITGSRVVRGGPVTLGPNNRDANTWGESVSARGAWDVRTMDSEVGFRCAKSARPRFSKDSPAGL
jgi:serine/threonine protein kinase/formylglycine-generating enzyme required for sulfatase activity